MDEATSTLARLAPVRQAAERAPVAGSRLPGEVVRTIRDQGLWKLWVPRAYGGAELDLPASLTLFEAAGALDGSIGFAVAIGTGGGLFSAYLPEHTARLIFSPDEALIAGSGAPTGIATATRDGFRVSGRWQYASLIHEATWVTANTRRSDTDAVMAVAVPASQVAVIEDWNVHALSATDSQSIEMRDLPVPADHTFSLAGAPRLGAPLYRFPFDAIAAASFAAVAAGIGRGAIEAFVGRIQVDPDDTSPAAARAQRLARSIGLQQAARSHLISTAATAWQEVVETGGLREASDARVHLAAVTATAQVVDAVESLAQVAGMSLLREDDRFSRCWRDLHGLAQHAYLSRVREGELGARLARL